MNHARLRRQCFGNVIEIALTQCRQQIRWHLQSVTIALHVAVLDQEIYAFTLC